MPATNTEGLPCDLCGSTESIEVPCCRAYTGDQAIDICRRCGFVFVRHRRSPDEIAGNWSNELFGEGYTARIPWMKARHVFVAEFLHVEIGLAGKRLCDIGAGEGQFLEIIRQAPYNAQAFGTEHSPANCALLEAAGIENFQGTIEDYVAAGKPDGHFDIVTIMWTLENCHSCTAMVEAADAMLKPGGHICVATGSRILVPFKKPLHYYFSRNPADTHSFRFSANTLIGLLAKTGFEASAINRYIDNDILCVIAAKTDRSREIPWQGDDPEAVADFFTRWHAETREHYAHL